jgi:hypothetical protein
MLATPTFDSSTLTGGGTIDVHVTVSAGADSLAVGLYDLNHPDNPLGNGAVAIPGGSTDGQVVTVPVSPTSCLSTATQAYALVFPYNAAAKRYAEYSFNAANSATDYTLQYGDDRGNAPPVATGIPLGTAGWQQGVCTSLADLAAQPTEDVSSVALGGQVTVTLPLNDAAAAAKIVVVVFYSVDSGSAGGSAYATVSGNTATAKITMSSGTGAQAGHQYYADLRVYGTNTETGSFYTRSPSVSTTNYTERQSDGFAGKGGILSPYTLLLLNVTAP